MRPLPPDHDNRRVRNAAIGLVVVLLALVVAQLRAPARAPVVAHARAGGHQQPEAPLPTAVSGTVADAPVAGIPALELDAVAAAKWVDTEQFAAQPRDFVGSLFLCRNTLNSLPIHWNPSDLRSASTASDKVREVLEEAAPGLAQQRLPLSCKTPDLHLISVQVYFDRALIGALPAIARDTQVTLQLLGVGPAGELVARYVRVTALPRPLPLPDPLRPDWLAALMRTEPGPPAVMTCLSGAPPRLLPTRSLDAATLAALASLPDVEPAAQGPVAVAQLSCVDGRQLQVPVIAKFSPSQADELLAVTEGSQLQLRVLHAVENRVVAGFQGVVARGDPAPVGDLRRLLLEPQSAIGKVVRCVSLGLPTAETVEVADADAQRVDLTAFANRKSWLVCDQAPRPPLQVTLWLDPAHVADLLAIGRGTEVSLRVLGVDGDRLLAALDRVVARPTEPDLRREDLRRYVLQSDTLIGQKLRCALGRELELVGSAQAPETARRLFASPPAGAPRLATCLDALRPFEGQRFLVFWPDGHPASADLPHTGVAIELELRGLVDNLPVAGFVRRLDRP